jgi:LCP family protein required for cell wall assembly
MSELRFRPRRQQPGPIARHGMLRKPSPLTTALKFLGITIAVVSISAASITAIAVADVLTSVKGGVDLVAAGGAPPTVGPIEGAVNILLAGSDSGDGDPQYGKRGENLNDVTMLLHISADHQSAVVVSFPRDMFVPIPRCPNDKGGTYPAMSSQKINVTLTYGGLACTVLTVEKLTGLSIPYAAEVGFNGVAAMSNAVGGVSVCVAERIDDDYTGTHLSVGEHVLQGEAALEFLRTRHGIGDGSDLGRISNQQVFLSSLMRTVKSANTLSNPITVLKLAKSAASNMILSKSLNHVDTMISIAVALKNLNLSDFVFVQYPTVLGTSGDQSGVLPIKSAATLLVNAIASDQPIALSGKTGIGAVPEPGTTSTPTSSLTPTPAPTATSKTTAPAPTATPKGTTVPSATATPAPSGTPSPSAVTLPDYVTGQTATEQTCSKGRPLKNQ